MTRTLRIYVGHGFTPRLFVRELLQAGIIQGATITPAFGYWVADDGTLFDEDADVITFTVESSDDVDGLVRLAQGHARITGEQSVMVERPDGTVIFADAEVGVPA